MINQYTITSDAWTQITQPGETGVCWLDDDRELNEDRADVRIWHGTAAPTDDDVTKGCRVLSPKSNNDFVSFSSQNEDDVFYARCRKSGDSAILSVDIKGVGTQKIDGDVAVQDQSTEIVDVYLCRNLGTTTLATAATVNTRTVTLADGHGFVVGNVICIRNGTWYQGRVLTVAGDVITVNQPFNSTYPIVTPALRNSSDLNVDGSGTPVVFSMRQPVGRKWDICRALIVIRDDAAMDDGKFGALPALTNGVMFRVKKSATHYNNLFAARNNGEFAIRAYDVAYIDATLGPSGQYGLRVRRSFNGFDKNGVVIRLDGDDAENELQVVVQDNLTGLSYFSVVLQGHVVED